MGCSQLVVSAVPEQQYKKKKRKKGIRLTGTCIFLFKYRKQTNCFASYGVLVIMGIAIDTGNVEKNRGHDDLRGLLSNMICICVRPVPISKTAIGQHKVKNNDATEYFFLKKRVYLLYFSPR